MVPAEGVTNEDVAPWLDHMALMFGPLNETACGHVLNFMAFVLQRPGEKINHALLVYGATQGTGKDSAFVPLWRALGEHNYQIISPQNLIAEWTDYLERQVVCVAEMYNFNRGDVANKLKSFLASPPFFNPVNKKHQRIYNAPNIQNWIFFSNHDNAVALEYSDRRYCVIECLLETRRPDKYYKVLHRWFKDGGIEKVVGWLMQRDLSAFNPMAAPPVTEAKRAMAVRSQSKQVQWAYAELTAGEFAARSIVLCRELVWKAKTDDDAPVVTDKHVSDALKAAGLKRVGQRMKINGDARQLWARDSDGSLSRLSADQLRDRYLAEAPPTPLRRLHEPQGE